MWLIIEDHDNLFIMAEFVHFAGIGMLLYKLFSKKNAGGESLKLVVAMRMRSIDQRLSIGCISGLSLRSQELSALFLGIRLFCRQVTACTSLRRSSSGLLLIASCC